MKRVVFLCAVAALVVLALRRPAVQPVPLVTETRRPARAEHHKRPASLPTAVVYVAGAVVRPGLYTVSDGARAAVAVGAAGGFTAQADPVSVNLAERVSDGEEIAVLRVGEARTARSRSHAATHGRRRKGRRRAAAPSSVLDLNSADADALASLPGVGAILAARIVDYRRVNGPFASVDELADVAGMTQRRVDQLAPYLHAEPAH